MLSIHHLPLTVHILLLYTATTTTLYGSPNTHTHTHQSPMQWKERGGGHAPLIWSNHPIMVATLAGPWAPSSRSGDGLALSTCLPLRQVCPEVGACVTPCTETLGSQEPSVTAPEAMRHPGTSFSLWRLARWETIENLWHLSPLSTALSSIFHLPQGRAVSTRRQCQMRCISSRLIHCRPRKPVLFKEKFGAVTLSPNHLSQGSVFVYCQEIFILFSWYHQGVENCAPPPTPRKQSHTLPSWPLTSLIFIPLEECLRYSQEKTGDYFFQWAPHRHGCNF